MMKIAVMQPYLFPYVGYFQLISAVDKFVFYDDVNYIARGWINRNRILVNGSDFIFTIPLQKASQFDLIKDTLINAELYENWRIKFFKSIELSYKKAPFYDEVLELIKSVLYENHSSISQLAMESIHTVAKYMGITTEFIVSSKTYSYKDLDRQDRLIAITKQEKATHYINAIGGQELYNKKSFKEKGVELSFIKPLSIRYKQYGNDFIPWLSIIDVLMFNDKAQLNKLLNEYELL